MSVLKGVLCPFLTVPWVGLQCVVVVFPVHTHFPVALKIAICLNHTSTTHIILEKGGRVIIWSYILGGTNIFRFLRGGVTTILD